MRLQHIFHKPFIFVASIGLFAAFVGYGMVFARGTTRHTQAVTCEGICVSVTESGLKPDELAIKVGEFVQFNSADGKTHNFSFGEGSGETNTESHHSHGVSHEHQTEFASGDFGADEAWRVQFKKPGTYKIHDHYNPKLNILIVVYE